MMRFSLISIFSAAFAIGGFSTLAGADTPRSAPDFQEVYDLLKSHHGALGDQELNDAAVKGLIERLSPRIQILGDTDARDFTNKITRANVFDGDIAYFRIANVEEGTAAALQSAFSGLSSSNHLRGLAIDLRFASGNDYSAAGAVADLFIRKEQILLSWENGKVSSKSKTDSISLPIAVLINSKTTGAAEALAAVLREAGIALILGKTSAGAAMIGQDFPLKNGQRLRIATLPIHLGTGETLKKGVKPDIAVQVSSDDETIYFADPFSRINHSSSASGGSPAEISVSSTNRTGRRSRFNEAELVRERREAASSEDSVAEARREREPEKPSVSDPVLSRALDLLKGLAVIHQYKS